MTEEMIINNREEREKLVQRINVLENVKNVLLIPNTEFATMNMVADYYEVSRETINSLVKDNREEINEDGLLNVTGNETKAILVKSHKNFTNLRGCFVCDGIKFANRSNLLFPRRAILRVGMLLRDSEIAKEVRTQLLNIEENASKEQKLKSINEEETLLMNIAFAYKSGSIDKVMAATSAYTEFQNRYIKELEPKAKIVDDMIKNDSSVTTTIAERIKDTDVAKRWNREIKDNELGKSTVNVLIYIHDFINEYGYSPAVREIGKNVGLSSTSTVHAHMDKLNRLGYIAKDTKKTRNIRVNEEKYAYVLEKLK